MSLLETRDLTARYGDFQALFGVDINLNEGECVAIIGANGAGKTTLMRAISGVLGNAPGQILLDGSPIGDRPSDEVMGLGIAMVPEGRKLFPSLTVEENLLIGTYGRKATGPWTLQTIYDLFPILKERRRNPGTALSGGQQQMVAIGRALMSQPRVLLLDEPFLGLAPMVVEEIRHALNILRQDGMTMILVEQKLDIALPFTSRTHVMIKGQLALVQDSAQLMESPDLAQLYFRLAQPLS